MSFLNRWYGITEGDADRDPAAERARCEEIVEKVRLMQTQAAAKEGGRLRRGTHAKGTTARAQFEVFDLAAGREPALAKRLARGIFARPGTYPAIVRFANSLPDVKSDFHPDVRALSISVDLTRGGTTVPADGVGRQDFSLQNATTLPLNDTRVFLATMKVLTASNPAKGLWSLSLRDQVCAARALLLAGMQSMQRVRPYQNLRYWSTVPFRHGPAEAVKQSATPSPANPARPLKRNNPNALQDELARHLNEDGAMASFDIGLQLLDVERMTYGGERRDASFWIENASIEWREAEAPFHTVARLTLVPKSLLSPEAGRASYFDVTSNASPDSAPLGSINRARRAGELASREARLRARP